MTVECTERGELLGNLRKRYADLLDRIPRQVKRCAVNLPFVWSLWFSKELLTVLIFLLQSSPGSDRSEGFRQVRNHRLFFSTNSMMAQVQITGKKTSLA